MQVLLDAGGPLHYQEIAARIVNSGFPTTGKTPARTVSRELTTHPDLFRKTADGTYTLTDWHDAGETGSRVEPGSISGQGYQPSAEIRRLIERYAMQIASSYFRELAWRVADVSATEPYDLDCSKPSGEQLCVEVKGTATDGTQLILTRNEVAFARAHFPRTALYVLANEVIGEENGVLVARAGKSRLFCPWNVDDGLLAPLTYAYMPLL